MTRRKRHEGETRRNRWRRRVAELRRHIDDLLGLLSILLIGAGLHGLWGWPAACLWLGGVLMVAVLLNSRMRG